MYVGTKSLGNAVPKDIRVTELTEHQKRELHHLKAWLYRTRRRESTRRRHALEAEEQLQNIHLKPEPHPQMAFASMFEGFNKPG